MGTGETKKAPTLLEWYTGLEQRKITVYTDYCLQNVVDDGTIRIAWIIEPREIAPHVYSYISNPDVYKKFNTVITHDLQLTKLDSRFKVVPLCGHWIYDEDIAVHSKSKNLSIIASGKRQTTGHQLRHAIIDKYKNNIDGIFGNGYVYIPNKIIGLKDYRFHIVIENVKKDFWFTEKLIDAFITGCIPIYCGCPSIGKYFNTNGMILIDSINDFDNAINTYVNEDFYNKKLPIIKENFERAKQFMYPEDYFYNEILKKQYEQYI
jgi:hypothetical protein